MPRKAKEMGALDVKRLKHPGRGRNVAVAVGGVDGLALQMTPTGARSWVLRTVVGGRRRELGLGGYPDVTLGQARERARAAKDAIRQGVDPVEKRKAARAVLVAARKRGLSFAEAVERTCATKLGEFRSDKHRAQWRTTLDTYAAPELGGMLVADIDVHDVLRVLEPIWASKTETASRLRGRIETVLAWATVGGHRKGDNPARWRGNLDALLSKPGKMAKVDEPAGAGARRCARVVHGAAPARRHGRAGVGAGGALRLPQRRGPGRGVERGRPRREALDDPGGANEGRPRAPRAAERRGGGAAPGTAAVRGLAPRLHGAARRDARGHEPSRRHAADAGGRGGGRAQGMARPALGASGGAARAALDLPRLGGRARLRPRHGRDRARATPLAPRWSAPIAAATCSSAAAR